MASAADTSEWQVAGKKSGKHRKLAAGGHSHIVDITAQGYAVPEGPPDAPWLV